MPKGNDSLCPLGFHPQFRRPNYCKRCFREYNEHKSAKEGSSTSVNSLSYERRDDTYGSREGLTRSRSDLTRTSSEDEDRYTKRPMSWSAQDLRKAVDEAKEQVRTTREEVKRYYGSTRSLSQDLGTLSHLLHDNPDITKDTGKTAVSTSSASETPKTTSSFSSYLATTSRSPARPPLTKTTSLHGGPSSTPSYADGLKTDTKDKIETKTTEASKSSTTKTSSTTSSSSPSSSSLSSPTSSSFTSSITSAMSKLSPTSSETKTSKLSTKLKREKLSPSPEPPPSSDMTSEMSRAERNKKIIESLREVKSEDADASYVIRIRPKKEASSGQKKVEIDLQPEVERLQKENKEILKQIKELTAKNEEIEKENKVLQAKKPRFGELRKQTPELPKLQSKIDDLSEEIKAKNKEIKELKNELDKRPLPKNVEKTMADLRSKLAAAEQLCEELMDENEDYKKEVRTLEDEIEEMQDNFREEQADEYRDLKRELEQRAKDCRVLQFKLKKAERRSESLERDKGEFEEKLRELQVGEDDIGRAERIKGMEKELSLAKEVSMKMHEEMEKMKAQLELAEIDKKKLREKVQETPAKPGTKVSRSQVIGRQGSQDNIDQVLRDLQDSLEREQDIKEQLRFAEEETKNLRKKLSRVEEENETLQLQLNKMSSKAKQTRQRSMERSGSTERSNSVERGSLSRQGSTEKPPPPIVNGEELDPTEMKIQLELNEQESTILRRKVEDLESENMRLQKELKELLLSSSESKKTDFSIIPEISKDNVYFNKKIKMLEQEATDLRKKVIDYEKERDQLRTELETVKKRAKVVRSRSLEQAEAEEKKAQETLENETEILKQKIKEMEDKYEEMIDENKRLTLKAQKRLPVGVNENLFIEKQVLEDKIMRLEKKLKKAEEKLKAAPPISKSSEANNSRVAELQTKVDELQAECNRLAKDNEEMKSGSAYGERTPKKPRELTPKATLIKWVNELESECGTLHVTLKEMEKKQGRTATEDQSTGIRDLQDKLQKEKERNEELTRQLREERGKADEKLAEQRRSRAGGRDSSLEEHYEARIKELRKELDEERKKEEDLQAQLKEMRCVDFDELRTAQTEKHKLQKELASSQQIVNVMERKLRETEETLKISEKAERNLRSLLEKAESRLEEGRNSQSTLHDRQKDLAVSWLKERDDLKKELTVIKKEKDLLQMGSRQAESIKKSLESQLLSEKKKVEESEGKLKTEKDQLKKLRKANDELQIELDECKDSINRMSREKERIASRLEKEISQLKKEREDMNIRMTTLETEIKMERKKRERLEKDTARLSTSELEDMKDKLFRAEHEKQKQSIELNQQRQEYDSKIASLDKRLAKEKKNYEDLHYKFDSLVEECAMQKLELSESAKTDGIDKATLKKELDTLEQELKTLRETYILHQDTWIKEKLDLQLQLKEYQNKPKDRVDGALSSEKLRLKNIIEDKNQTLDSLRIETETLKDQLANSRRECDDLRKKVEDLDKLQELTEKHGTSSSVDTKGYESTIRELRSRLTALEKTHKSEITKMKMRYDTKVRSFSEETSTVTQHMSKYRRERDTYKEMLEGAQKTIAELKGSSTAGTYRASRADNATEVAAAAKRQADHQAKTHLSEVQDLQSALTELEDKLADSRLEATKMKNELMDQKTNYEIQLSDMQTRLNEYEEDRLLGGSARRVPGLRTRLELNWQKEREEQQRLIQETATLAKDLRQTLYEVERERDLERLEAKRKLEQLKRTVNQDHHDTKSKVHELQRDLQELREAHAKLRQINEKLRREKDRTEVEREAMRDKFLGSSREHLNQQTKIERLLDELRKVKDLAPLVLGEGIDEKDLTMTKLPGDPKPKTKEEFIDALKKLNRTSDDLRVMMSLGDERDRMRRTPSFRRALSAAESDDESSARSHSVGRRGGPRAAPRNQRSQLHRKSQSLDHQLAEERGKIWVSTDAGSTSSIESSMTDEARKGRYDMDRSLDRISTGSQTSDLDLTSEQKKKTVKGVFSKFGKSKSIEDTNTAGSIVGVGIKALAPGLSGSGSSITSETDKDSSVKTRLKTLFKKGPPSRSQSVESDTPTATKSTSQAEGDSSSVTSKRPRSTIIE